MTLSTTSNTVIAQGNGLTTSFDFGFPVPLVSELSVYYTDVNGNITTLGSQQYAATGIGTANGGSITYPLSGTPIATGTSLTIQRIVPYQQLTDLVNQSGYYPNVVENALDYLTMQTQQLAQGEHLSLKVPLSASASNLTFPSTAARANTLAGFDSSGNAVTYPVSASIGAGNMTVELGSNGHPGFKSGTDFTVGQPSVLTLSKAYGSVGNVFTAWDGIYQERDSYQITANQILFGSWAGSVFTVGTWPAGLTNVDVVGGTTLSIGVAAQGSIVDSMIAPGSSLYNRLHYEVSVVDAPFNADPTGVNDSTAAFNAAAATAQTIVVPDGTWKITGTVVTGTAAWDVSPHATFIGTQPNFRRGFWVDVNASPWGNGANIWRLNDRVMIGSPTLYDGKQNPVNTDWTGSTFVVGGVSAFGYLESNATLAVGSAVGQPSIVSAVRASDSGGAGNAAIGVSSVVLNDNTIGAGASAWNYYATSVKGIGATGGSTLGMEIDVTNLGNEVDLYPNAMFGNGLTANLWLGAGGELPYQTGNTYTFNKVSAAIGIFSNQPGPFTNCVFEKGIVFGSGGISSGVAVALPESYSITWFAANNAVTNALFSSATLTDAPHIQKLQFSDSGLLITDGSGNPQFTVANGVASAANYLQAQAAVSGQPAALLAQGLDPNIVLALTPKGSGTLQFGTYTAGVLTGTGYITIRDSGGTIRRLLVG